MLQRLADLSDAYEYFLVWTGQSNARPWGAKADGLATAPDLNLVDVGATVRLKIAVGSGTETLVLAAGTLTGNWAGAKLRLGSETSAVAGYATVLLNTTTTLRVTWTVNAATSLDQTGYLTRSGFTGAFYPQVRILTPYQPTDDDSEAVSVPYPTANAAFTAPGRRLLAPGYTVPAGVTTFENLGLLLPFSFQEGISGFGVSDVGCSDGAAAPTLASVGPTSLGFTGTALVTDFFIDGYLRVDWETGGATKLSWAVVTDNDTTSVTISSWLGDGQPTAHTDIKRWTLWVPHYNDSPHAFMPGEGFTYPNNDMQPGGVAPQQAASAIGTATGSTTTSLTVATANWVPNQYAGWLVTMDGKTMTVVRNTANTMYGSGWSGGGTPAAGAYLVATTSYAGATVRNRPRAAPYEVYGDRFGALLPFAYRLSAMLGKRVNVIHLGVNSASIVPQSEQTLLVGFKGVLGWWDSQVDRDFSLTSMAANDGILSRLQKLITTVAPNALLAEGNTKTAKVLGVVFPQGEGDALSVVGRSIYMRSLRTFFMWLRRVIDGAGMNPYTNGGQIPIVHPKITHTPWELSGTVSYYGVPITLSGDSEGLVNDAIVTNALTDGFGAYTETDDLPKLTNDLGHFNGVGEATNGARFADAMGFLIDKAMCYGSTIQVSTPPELAIWNLALMHLGETAQIASLTENSVQAGYCRALYPKARDTLLALRQWSFALVREALAPAVSEPDQAQWTYTYVVPYDALNVFAVIPAGAVDDYMALSDVNYEGVSLGAVLQTPVKFTVERSIYGHRILRTNLSDAWGRYVRRLTDASLYPDQFVMALSWYLASMLASPIVKGDQGEAVARLALQKAGAFIKAATQLDGVQRSVAPTIIPDHMAMR